MGMGSIGEDDMPVTKLTHRPVPDLLAMVFDGTNHQEVIDTFMAQHNNALSEPVAFGNSGTSGIRYLGDLEEGYVWEMGIGDGIRVNAYSGPTNAVITAAELAAYVPFKE
jgi:hypothetical protein